MLVVVIGDSTAPPSEGTNIALEQLHATRKPTVDEGLDALRELPFRLVLLDLSLPHASLSESITKDAQHGMGFAVNRVREPRRKRHKRVLNGYKSDCLIGIVSYAMAGEGLIVDRGQVGGR